MNNLRQEISDYVNGRRGSWSDTTISTAYSKLVTCSSVGLNPSSLYKKLETAGYSRYTIQTYFILARSFEEATKKTFAIRKWMQDNQLRFKNCYKPKIKRIETAEYETFLKKASDNTDLYNFLILLGKFGLRKSEAFNAKWEDFGLDAFCVQSGKGLKQRFVPLGKELLKDPKQVGFILNRDLRYWKFFGEIKPFTPHDFRAFAITGWVKERGLDLSEAAQIAGHARTDTTNRYIRNDLNKIKEKLNGNA